jgi:hypothetical protein
VTRTAADVEAVVVEKRVLREDDLVPTNTTPISDVVMSQSMINDDLPTA